MKRIVSDGELVGPWVARNIFGSWKGDPAIGLENDGEMIAGVIYENWNKRSVTCHIAIQGLMTPSYLGAIFHYPFVFLGCDKIICPVSEDNKESIRLCKKMGFVEEARIADAHPNGAILVFTMMREKCRFIGDRYGQKLTVAAAAA